MKWPHSTQERFVVEGSGGGKSIFAVSNSCSGLGRLPSLRLGIVNAIGMCGAAIVSVCNRVLQSVPRKPAPSVVSSYRCSFGYASLQHLHDLRTHPFEGTEAPHW